MAVQRIVNVGVESGAFDPVAAKVYRPVRALVNDEPKVTYAVVISSLHLRVMAGVTREAYIQGRQEAVGQQVFRVRRMSITEAVGEDHIIQWRGRTYEISGIGYPNLEELEWFTKNSDRVLT